LIAGILFRGVVDKEEGARFFLIFLIRGKEFSARLHV
jgi:hypothetical protein